MRNATQPVRSHASAKPNQGLMSRARQAAVSIAATAVSIFASGRWAATEKGLQSYQLATMILVREAEMGVICEESFATQQISIMAQAAHQIVQNAREEQHAGNFAIDLATDFDVVDPGIDMYLIPAYGLMAYQQ